MKCIFLKVAGAVAFTFIVLTVVGGCNGITAGFLMTLTFGRRRRMKASRGERIRETGLVMVGTPNQGTAFADRFQDDGWFKLLFEGAGQDLTSSRCLVAGKLDGEG